MASQIRYDLADRCFIDRSSWPAFAEEVFVGSWFNRWWARPDAQSTPQQWRNEARCALNSSENRSGNPVRSPALAVFLLRIKYACTKPACPQIKSGVRGEGASSGKRGRECRDGLGRGSCECSLFWRGDNPSIPTGQSCQSTPRWGPRHPLWFVICPVEGTSTQCYVTTPGIWWEAEGAFGHIWGRACLWSSPQNGCVIFQLWRGGEKSAWDVLKSQRPLSNKMQDILVMIKTF